MKLTQVICKPLTLAVIKSKKTGDEYIKLTGIIPVKETDFYKFSATNTGDEKFTTFELFDKVDDIQGIKSVIDNFDKVSQVELSGIWVKGSLNVASVKVIK